jgi:hypothetical protein
MDVGWAMLLKHLRNQTIEQSMGWITDPRQFQAQASDTSLCFSEAYDAVKVGRIVSNAAVTRDHTRQGWLQWVAIVMGAE